MAAAPLAPLPLRAEAAYGGPGPFAGVDGGGILGLSLFDLIAGALIAVCAVAGYRRGAVRELVGLFAFGLAVAAAFKLLPFTTPIARALFHVRWLTFAGALAIGFLVVWAVLHLLSGWLTARLHEQTVLGGANRALGLFVGAGRALFLLGLFTLVFDAVTPDAVKPPWVTSAFFYPLASASGRLIARLAPKTFRTIGHPGALLNDEDSPDTTRTDQTGAVETPAMQPAPPKRHGGKGYDRRSRDELDKLVESTR